MNHVIVRKTKNAIATDFNLTSVGVERRHSDRDVDFQLEPGVGDPSDRSALLVGFESRESLPRNGFQTVGS